MKAILEFDLFEERSEHAAAIHGRELAASLSAIAAVIRNREKHGDPSKEELETLARVREEIPYFLLDLIDQC